MSTREELTRLGERSLRLGKIEEAIAHYQALADLTPVDWNHVRLLGDLLERTNQREGAARQFCRWADHLAAEGFHSKASAIYKKVLKLEPTHEHAIWQLGCVSLQLKLKADARQFFQKVLDLRHRRGDLQGAAEARDQLAQLELATPTAPRHEGILAGLTPIELPTESASASAVSAAASPASPPVPPPAVAPEPAVQTVQPAPAPEPARSFDDLASQPAFASPSSTGPVAFEPFVPAPTTVAATPESADVPVRPDAQSPSSPVLHAPAPTGAATVDAAPSADGAGGPAFAAPPVRAGIARELDVESLLGGDWSAPSASASAPAPEAPVVPRPVAPPFTPDVKSAPETSLPAFFAETSAPERRPYTPAPLSPLVVSHEPAAGRTSQPPDVASDPLASWLPAMPAIRPSASAIVTSEALDWDSLLGRADDVEDAPADAGGYGASSAGGAPESVWAFLQEDEPVAATPVQNVGVETPAVRDVAFEVDSARAPIAEPSLVVEPIVDGGAIDGEFAASDVVTFDVSSDGVSPGGVPDVYVELSPASPPSVDVAPPLEASTEPEETTYELSWSDAPGAVSMDAGEAADAAAAVTHPATSPELPLLPELPEHLRGLPVVMPPPLPVELAEPAASVAAAEPDMALEPPASVAPVYPLPVELAEPVASVAAAEPDMALEPPVSVPPVDPLLSRIGELHAQPKIEPEAPPLPPTFAASGTFFGGETAEASRASHPEDAYLFGEHDDMLAAPSWARHRERRAASPEPPVDAGVSREPDPPQTDVASAAPEPVPAPSAAAPIDSSTSATPADGGEVDLTDLLEQLAALEGATTTAPGESSVGQTPDASAAELDAVFADLQRHTDSRALAEQQLAAGRVFLAAGLISEAARALERASVEPRTRFAAAQALAELHRSRGQMDEAVRWYETAAEAPVPDAADRRAVLYDLAESLEARGETERALGVLLDLLSQVEDYRDARARLDRLLRVDAGG